MMPIWTISLRFFSPPEKPTFTSRFIMSIDTPSASPCSRVSRRKSPAEISASPRARRWALSAVAEELDVGDARDLDRILEAEEEARGGALVAAPCRAGRARRG